MKEKNVFREYIEGLSELNHIEDPEVKAVDEALAIWINKHFPGGFEFDYERRNLMIAILKKTPETFELIMNSKLRPYIDGILNATWKKAAAEDQSQAKESIADLETNHVIMKLMRIALVFGHCLRNLEKKPKKRKKAAE